MPKQTWYNRITHASLAGVASYALDAIYQRVGSRARDEVLEELRRKGFDQIGPGEIVNSDAALYDLGTGETTHELTSLYEIHLWIQTCVAKVAQSLPHAPLRFYRAVGFAEGREEMEPWDDHPANALFRWINPHMDPFSFWEWTASFLQLCGMNYVAKVERSEGAPEDVPFDLYPLFPAFVRKVVDKERGVVRYRYRVAGEDEIILDAADVLYLKTFSPSDRFNGQGVLHSGRQTVLTDLRAQRFNDELLKNGVYIHGTLETEDDMEREDAEALRDTFVGKYGGQNNVAKVAVLWGGMSFKPHQIAHQDIQWLDQRKMSQEEIAVAHGVPLEILGVKAANYATLREKRKIFWQDTVQSLGTRIESQMNSTGLPLLFPNDPDLRCAWDYTQIDALQQDIKDIVSAGEIAIRSGQVTPDEWRQAQLSLPALGGASELQYLNGKPIELIVAEAARSIGEPPAQSGPPRQGDRDASSSDALPQGDEQQERRLLLAQRAPRIARVTHQPSTSGITTKSAQEWRSKWSKVEDRFEKRLGVRWREMSREVQREVGKLAASRSTLSEGEILRAVEHVFITEGKQEAASAARDIMKEGMSKWSAVVAAEAGIGDVFNLRNELAEQYARGRQKFYTEHFGRKGRDLSRLLADGFANGSSESEVAKSLQHFFHSYRNQAMTIARTEITGALNFSGSKAMESAWTNGVDVRSKWVTMQDGHVRGSDANDAFDHMGAEGLEIIPSQQLFIVSGEGLEFPGDTSNGASAGNTINCRCTTRPIVKGFR